MGAVARARTIRSRQLPAARRLVLCGLRIGRRAQAVECGLEDWSGVAGAAVGRGDGDDHVENLFQGEVVADLAGVLRSDQERPARGERPVRLFLNRGLLPSACLRGVARTALSSSSTWTLT